MELFFVFTVVASVILLLTFAFARGSRRTIGIVSIPFAVWYAGTMLIAQTQLANYGGRLGRDAEQEIMMLFVVLGFLLLAHAAMAVSGLRHRQENQTLPR